MTIFFWTIKNKFRNWLIIIYLKYIYILIRYWMVRWLSVCLWFCPFAIETTFPLSNFKTKYIFLILMKRVKFLKPFGAPKVLKIHQIYVRTFKLPNLTKNDILSNFDFYGWPSKSDILWVMTVANSRICTVSSGYPKIHEFSTDITQNIWLSKLFGMPFSVR